MLIAILHSCLTPLREQPKAWTTTCLTSEFLLCTVSVLQSKLWPTSWSPPQCGTVSLACPTRHGLVLPRFDSGETKATHTQVTEKEAAGAICSFSITKKSLLFKSDLCRVKVYRKSLLKMETRGKAKASPVLRTAASGLGAHVLSHGPSHPSLWTGTLGQMDLHHNLHFSPRRDFSMLQKYLIINHVTNNRLTGTLQKRSYNHFIEKRSDLTAQYYYHQWKQLLPWDVLDEMVSVPSITQCSFAVCSFKSFFLSVSPQ